MTSEENNWERDIIREMSKVFEQMGIPMDMDMLENMMNQLEDHFERMGIDSKSISKTDITLNGKGDPEEIRKNIEAMMSGPGGFADMLSKMGFEVSVKSSKNTPIEQVDVVTEPREDNRLIEIPITVYVAHSTVVLQPLCDLLHKKIEMETNMKTKRNRRLEN